MLTPKDELDSGEYAFMTSTKTPFGGVAMGLPNIEEAFDFGVDAK